MSLKQIKPLGMLVCECHRQQEQIFVCVRVAGARFVQCMCVCVCVRVCAYGCTPPSLDADGAAPRPHRTLCVSKVPCLVHRSGHIWPDNGQEFCNFGVFGLRLFQNLQWCFPFFLQISQYSSKLRKGIPQRLEKKLRKSQAEKIVHNLITSLAVVGFLVPKCWWRHLASKENILDIAWPFLGWCPAGRPDALYSSSGPHLVICLLRSKRKIMNDLGPAFDLVGTSQVSRLMCLDDCFSEYLCWHVRCLGA